MPRQLWLVRLAFEYLAGYVEALQRGWSADTIRGEAAARWTDCIAGWFACVLASRTSTLAVGRRALREHRLSVVEGDTRTAGLCLRHIGYSVVPWKRQRGYATVALIDLLEQIRPTGLPWVDLNTDPANVASQRVIEAAGGYFLDRYTRPTALGGGDGCRFCINLR